MGVFNQGLIDKAMKKKEYKNPEIDIEIFTITADICTTSGFGWEEEDDPAYIEF